MRLDKPIKRNKLDNIKVRNILNVEPDELVNYKVFEWTEETFKGNIVAEATLTNTTEPENQCNNSDYL